MNLEVIDNEGIEKVQESIFSSLTWWEKRRVWFNIIVGILGLICLLMFARGFVLLDLVGVIFYGIAANVFYSTGFALEALILFYFKGRYQFTYYRGIIFSIGLIFSCLLTVLGCVLTYSML